MSYRCLVIAAVIAANACVNDGARNAVPEPKRPNVVVGAPFAPTFGRAMCRTGSCRGVVVELWEQEVLCNEPTVADTLGTRWLSFGTYDDPAVGEYPVKAFPQGGDGFASATVTVASETSSDGVTLRSTVFSGTSIHIDEIGERLVGTVDVGDDNDNHYQGSFDVSFCPQP